MTTSNHKKSFIRTNSLYYFVYISRLVRCAVFILFFSIILQPTAAVFAAPFDEVRNQTEDDFSLSVDDITDAESTVTETFDDLVFSETETETAADVDSLLEADETNEDIVTNEVVLETEELVKELSEELSSAETDDTSSSNVETQEGLVQVAYNDNNFYQFSKTSCVPVKGGSFYCSSNNPAAPVEMSEENVFAAPDSDGDLEIFVRGSEGLTQITFNNSDDAAPYFDEISNSIVWHRLVNDRYQIVWYDVNTGDEHELTHDVVNNMEPHRFGEYIVWQRWVTDNWEIMLFDGKRTEQLTSTVYHDIAPQVRGDQVLWKTVMADKQVVNIYDIKTRSIREVAGDSSSGLLSNPRLLLVYDEQSKDGAIVTRAYNPETGEQIDLFNTRPARAPIDIPSSDQTGETRALLTTASSTKEQSVDGNNDSDSSDDSEIDDFTLVISSSTEPLIVDQNDITLDLSEDVSFDLETDEETLVIPPFTATTAAE